jgi:hypothetical protein
MFWGKVVGLVANPPMDLFYVLVGADGDGRGPAIVINFNELGWFINSEFLALWVVFLVESNLHIWLHLLLDCPLLLQVKADARNGVITFFLSLLYWLYW